MPHETVEERDAKSTAMKRLLLEPGTDGAAAGAIPRTLVQYWDDLENLPDDVERCMSTWKGLAEAGFEIVVFDDRRAREFLASYYGGAHVAAFDRCSHPAMRCDYFRMGFVLAHGGFYVDADDAYVGKGWERLYLDDTLKLQPLCYDLETDIMVPPGDFLRADAATDGRIYYVNNNPVVAPPGHPLLDAALKRATRLLDTPPFDIQATTGPGNMTKCLLDHAAGLAYRRVARDYSFLGDWHLIARTVWELSYRGDARNWRNVATAKA